jgi:CRP-like cAMP-binding protein
MQAVDRGIAMRYYPIKKKKFQRGEIIFSEDSEADGMYIVETGRVRVFKTAGGDGKKEIELCTLGPKAMFGEMAMIDDNPRSASVQAVAPTVCTVITRKTFEEQLGHIPVWMVNMIRILVMRLRETNDKLRTIIEENSPGVPADTGRVITVDEDPSCQKESAPEKRFKSEEIVKDLYKEK